MTSTIYSTESILSVNSSTLFPVFLLARVLGFWCIWFLLLSMLQYIRFPTSKKKLHTISVNYLFIIHLWYKARQPIDSKYLSELCSKTTECFSTPFSNDIYFGLPRDSSSATLDDNRNYSAISDTLKNNIKLKSFLLCNKDGRVVPIALTVLIISILK